jgi:hypothetical protein
MVLAPLEPLAWQEEAVRQELTALAPEPPVVARQRLEAEEVLQVQRGAGTQQAPKAPQLLLLVLARQEAAEQPTVRPGEVPPQALPAEAARAFRG